MKEIKENDKSFEDIKHIDENNVEFWYARELMSVLQYSNWQNFEKIKEGTNYLKINLNQIYNIDKNNKEIKFYLDNDLTISIKTKR